MALERVEDQATTEAPAAEAPTNGTAPILKILTAADILSKVFVPELRKVDVPEWGGAVFVKELSGKERDNFEISQLEGRSGNQRVNLQNMRAKLVAFSTVDEKGNRLFTVDDAKRLGDLSAKALTRVYRVAAELSGITGEDEQELTQELGEAQGVSSGSN